MLARAQELGFQAVVTVDTGIPFQQNVSQMRLAVVVLHVWRNNLDRLIPLAPAVLETLTNAAPGRVYHVHDAAATR